MSPQRFEFEGKMLTVAEIRSQLPLFSDATIRFHLRNGRNTKQSMLTFNARAAMSAGAKRGKQNGWLATRPFFHIGKKKP